MLVLLSVKILTTLDPFPVPASIEPAVPGTGYPQLQFDPLDPFAQN